MRSAASDSTKLLSAEPTAWIGSEHVRDEQSEKDRESRQHREPADQRGEEHPDGVMPSHTSREALRQASGPSRQRGNPVVASFAAPRCPISGSHRVCLLPCEWVPIGSDARTRSSADTFATVPLLALLLIAVVVGGIVARVSLAVSRRHPGQAAARKMGTAVAERPELRMATRRTDSESVTGLALAVAFAIVLCGGLLLAVLAFLVRSDSGLVRLDRSVAQWGQRHASPFTDHVLNAITFVGQPVSIGVLAALVAVEETIRTRNRWIAPFMLVVIAGTGLLTTTVKELADRARPAFNPIAETLGPSFPSGHSSWSAAFLAATALDAQPQPRPTRARRTGRRRGRTCGVGRRDPRTARDALAQRRHRGPRARLGLVRRLRDRLRRARAEVRRRRPESPPAGARRRPRAAGTSARVKVIGASTRRLDGLAFLYTNVVRIDAECLRDDAGRLFG